MKEQLHERPSAEQEALLKDMADLDKKYFILTAGRGSGKTMVVSWIVAWSMAVLPLVYGKYNCAILGGSEEQSRIMYDYFKGHIYETKYLDDYLLNDATKTVTEFFDGKVLSLPASEKRVRGPHPELLILDEVCEIDDELTQSALPMVTGSAHGRVIMLSTPHRFFGIFQDYWDNASSYGYVKHGPWPLTNCWWIDQDWVDLMRIQYKPEKFNVEILGIPTSIGSLVFDADDIDCATTEKPFGMNPNYPHDGGIDWGQLNPTVLVKAQSYNGKIWFPGPDQIWERKRYAHIFQEIMEHHDRDRGQDYYCDNSHKGEIERLEDAGVAAEGIVFTRKMKEELVEMIQMLLYHDMLRISPDNNELIRQLKKYRWVMNRDKTDEKLDKKEVDSVEAFMLSLWSLKESGWSPEPQKPILARRANRSRH